MTGSQEPVVLVTGGAGFIGSHLTEILLAHGLGVVVLDALSYAGSTENLAACRDDPRFAFVQGDIRDRALLARLLAEYSPRAVINVAAETHVDRSIDSPDPFVQTNIVGTFELLEAVRRYWNGLDGDSRAAFRFLQVSTDEVFGSVDEGGFTVETDPYRPNSPYSASKAAADHMVRAYHHTYKLPTLITHGSNTYGPRQFPEKLIPVIILNALEGNKLPVYGDGRNQRDWLHVTDHARGILTVLEQGAPGQAYNVGGDNQRANIDICGRICALLDAMAPRRDGGSYADQIAFVTDRPGHDFRYALDTGRLRGLGWSQQTPFDAGLAATVGWYLDNRQWCRKMTGGQRERLGLGNKGGANAS